MEGGQLNGKSLPLGASQSRTSIVDGVLREQSKQIALAESGEISPTARSPTNLPKQISQTRSPTKLPKQISPTAGSPTKLPKQISPTAGSPTKLPKQISPTAGSPTKLPKQISPTAGSPTKPPKRISQIRSPTKPPRRTSVKDAPTKHSHLKSSYESPVQAEEAFLVEHSYIKLQPIKRKKGSVLYSQFCCLFCASPCSLCCSTCPSIRESSSTRLMYLLMFAFTILLCLVSLLGSVPEYLVERFPVLDRICTSYLNTSPKCQGLFANHITVYKICCGQLSLHLVLMMVTFCANNSLVFPGVIHNGFWLWKWAWIIGAIVLIFLEVPNEAHILWYVMKIVGLFGGCLFIIVNIFFMCEFAFRSNKNLLDKAKTNCCYYVLIWVITIILLGISVIFGYILFAFYFECKENKSLGSAIIYTAGFLLFVTILTGLFKRHKNADLLQGSIVVLYIMSQTFGAMHNKPPGRLNTDVLLVGANTPGSVQRQLVDNNPNETEDDCRVSVKLGGWGSQWDGSNTFGTLWLQYAGLTYYMAIALYISIDHTRKHAAAMKRFKNEHDEHHEHQHVTGCCYSCKVEHTEAGQQVIYNEDKASVYNYCYLHFQFVVSILFVMMTLTNWFNPGVDIDLTSSKRQGNSWSAYWVQIATSWLAILVYLSTLCLQYMIKWLRCQKNTCFMKIQEHIPLILDEENVFYDKNGEILKDLASYVGVLYTKDDNGELTAIRRINRLTAADVCCTDRLPIPSPIKKLSTVDDAAVRRQSFELYNNIGEKIANVGAYEGIIYTLDEENNLIAARQVIPVDVSDEIIAKFGDGDSVAVDTGRDNRRFTHAKPGASGTFNIQQQQKWARPRNSYTEQL